VSFEISIMWIVCSKNDSNVEPNIQKYEPLGLSDVKIITYMVIGVWFNINLIWNYT
jgi:hypothetical protein